jgi:glycosidase
MAVIIDWVSNQTSWDHPWITEHKDWYMQDAEGNILQFSTYSDVAALNFSNTAMRAEMINAMRYWVFTTNIDGFRCDFADNPPFAYWQEAFTSLRGISSHKLLLLAEGSHSSNFTAGFDFNFGFHFYYNSILPIYESDGSVTLINSSNSTEYNSASTTQQVARYLTNHDIYGSDGSPYTIFGGKKGTLAAFVVTAYMKSVPFIYNGMEVGNTVPMPFPFTSSVIDWTEDESITPEMTNIIAIRNASEAIRRGKLTTYSNADVCAFKKESGSEAIFVLVNLRDADKTFSLPEGIAGSNMHDVLTNTDIVLGTEIALSAYEYQVYSKEIDVSVRPVESGPATSSIAYPNPVVDGFVTLKLPDSFSNVTLAVFDFQGRNVYDASLSASESTLDLSCLNKGLYVIAINSAQQTEYHKMLIK